MILALSMSLQERDIARKLANAESCNMASAKRKSIIDSVMCDGLQHALSYKLWQDNCLEYTDIVPDGFYDAWGDFSDIVSSSTDFPSLHDLRSIPRVAGDAREVLLVDHSADPGLCTAVEHLTERLSEDSSIRDKIQVRHCFRHVQTVTSSQAIAEVVCSALGGSATTKELRQSWLQASQAAKKRHRGIVIPLGELQAGLHRHRALLFKVLADSIKLPCRMVRSGHNVPPGGPIKAAALVWVDGTEVIVDLLRSPGRTVPFTLGGDLTKLLGAVHLIIVYTYVIIVHTATPPHSRTNSFNNPSAFALSNGNQPPALEVPTTVPDLMTFDSPLGGIVERPRRPLPDLPEHGSSPPAEPAFERVVNGKDASRPVTPAASSRPQTGRVASPSSPTQAAQVRWAVGAVAHHRTAPLDRVTHGAAPLGRWCIRPPIPSWRRCRTSRRRRRPRRRPTPLARRSRGRR